MPSSLAALHIAMALVLFLTMNWMGRHLGYSGYITLSAFLQRDSSPAFNFFYRALSPTAFIIVIATALYSLHLPAYVVDIWRVVLYYYVARLVYVVLFSRVLLVNWTREALLWVVAISFSWVIYTKFITNEQLLLPEPKELAKDFWLFVVLFLYALGNHLRFGDRATKRRKENYIRLMYRQCSERYGSQITQLADDRLSESLIYAVLIFEAFNRPALVRIGERAVFPWASKSLGPMQVMTTHRITDLESIRVGASNIMATYRRALAEGQQTCVERKRSGGFDPVGNRNHRSYVIYKVASTYNKDDNYLHGITEMHSQLVEIIFTDLQFAPYAHWSEQLI